MKRLRNIEDYSPLIISKIFFDTSGLIAIIFYFYDLILASF